MFSNITIVSFHINAEKKQKINKQHWWVMIASDLYYECKTNSLLLESLIYQFPFSFLSSVDVLRHLTSFPPLAAHVHGINLKHDTQSEISLNNVIYIIHTKYVYIIYIKQPTNPVGTNVIFIISCIHVNFCRMPRNGVWFYDHCYDTERGW